MDYLYPRGAKMNDNQKPARRRNHDVRFLHEEIERLRKERNEWRDRAGRAEAKLKELEA